MNIVVNTRLLLKRKLEGIGWFTFETFKRIAKQHPEHTYFFVFDRPYDKEFVFEENVKPIVAWPQARHPLLFWWWFEITIPRILRKVKADIFVSPDGYLSLRTKVPQLGVIHDINFEHFPYDLPWVYQKYYRTFFPRFAKKSKRIATVSEFSKADIQQQYGIDADKIDVVYNGVNEMFHPIIPAERVVTKKKYTDGYDYFIFIGALIPRKNLRNLFLAFEVYRRQTGTSHKLLIVGASKWWTSDVQNVYEKMEFKQDVVFIGRVEATVLNQMLASATALLYLSYFEGFGIPLLEAFACGVPVITSNVTSMPEVAGNAALLVNPFDPESIAEAMEKISKDDSLAESLVLKGKERLKAFSWDKTATLLWNSIEITMNEKQI